MSQAAVGGITQAQVSVLTTKGISQMKHPEWLSVAAVSSLSGEQVAAISTSFSAMSAAWLNALTPAAIAGLTQQQLGQLTSAACAGVNNQFVAALSATQLNYISHLEWMPQSAMAVRNDVIYGTTGNDILSGTAGRNDFLLGGTGNDTYLMKRGQGSDVIVDYDTTVGNMDVISMASDIQANQIWFQHVSNDLQISLVGTNDVYTIKNWYSGDANQIEQIKTADGKVLSNANVEKLVQAMSSLSIPPVGATTLSTSYQTILNPVIAANWK